jgi:hypothetical protein
MIPALFPMMLLSSIAVDTGIALRIGTICNKTLFRFLKLSDQGCYCLITGFLFGFPMGAKTTSDMLQKGFLSLDEAEYLLSFINCIGPMYTIHLIHTRFKQYALWTLITGLYAVPLCYGILLRYTVYRKCPFHSRTIKYHNRSTQVNAKLSFGDALYECVPKCGKSILMLGGYMILFQISFIPQKHLLQSLNIVTNTFYPLLELTGGLFQLPHNTSLAWILFYVTFGGACCFLQTYSFLRPVGLSMRKYAFHKTVLGLLAALYGIVLQIF